MRILGKFSPPFQFAAIRRRTEPPGALGRAAMMEPGWEPQTEAEAVWVRNHKREHFAACVPARQPRICPSRGPLHTQAEELRVAALTGAEEDQTALWLLNHGRMAGIGTFLEVRPPTAHCQASGRAVTP